MKYNKLFDVAAGEPLIEQPEKFTGDRRDGLVYLYTEEIELAVNVGLATGRPILLRGKSGSGKSSLALNVALRLGRRYYEEVVTSKTQHSDLLWRFDLLRRFRDAGAGTLKQDADYVEPRAFWWAFDPDLARRRGLKTGKPKIAATDPSPTSGEDAVILIDEIDKADPDVPNNLLVTLGCSQFSVPYVNDLLVKAEKKVLVFITSNDERDLPAAFLRRCVTLELSAPTIDRLVDIAVAHFGKGKNQRQRFRSIAEALYSNGGEASTAEYLDTVQACDELDVKLDDPTWKAVTDMTVRKTRS